MQSLNLYWQLPSFFSFYISDTGHNISLSFQRSADDIKIPYKSATKPEIFTVDSRFITKSPEVSPFILSTPNNREFAYTMFSYEFPKRKTIPAIISLTKYTAKCMHTAYVIKKNKSKLNYNTLNKN